VNSRLAWTASIAAVAAAVVGAGVIARRQHASTRQARCPAGLVAFEARCCAEGQKLEQNRCSGAPRWCPTGFDHAQTGCVVRPRRVRIAAGRLKVGPGDWEAQGVVQPREVIIDRAFWIDAYEVTVAAWNACAVAGSCPMRIDDEPGRPARAISFSHAQTYCSWAGGSLPTDDEWLLASAGTLGRRYPWGDTGAVCIRAGWGLAHGPCAQGDSGPDWVGIHAGDMTPEAVADMAGGVAEWVIRSDAGAATRGGSWTSSFAAELRTWHSSDTTPGERREDLGMRCRFDSDGTPGSEVLPSGVP
jgi:formylglycine-generating enzyme required for sulfatase activity